MFQGVPRAVIVGLAALSVAFVVVFGITAFGGEGTQSIRPQHALGSDLLPFWTGGAVLDDGGGRDLYSRRVVSKRQKAFARSPMRYWSAYPPPLYNLMAQFQGVDYPVAARVYLALLAALLALGGVLLAVALPELGPWRAPFAWAVAVSPVAFMALVTGQMAGAWFALLAGGILALRRGRPVLAGLLLGVLCAKPSIGVPVAAWLVLTGNGRAFAGFVGGGAAVLGASLWAHGPEPWIGFLEWVRGGGIGDFRPASSRQMTLRILLVYPFRKTAAAGPLETVALVVGLLAAVTAARRAFRLDPADPRWPLRAGVVLSALFVGLPYFMDYDQGVHALAVAGCLLALRSGAVARPRLGVALLVAATLGPLLNPLSRATHFSFGGLVLVAWFAWAWRLAREE